MINQKYFSDVTKDHMVSFNGFCAQVQSSAGPYVVLPSKSGGNDCPCTIILLPDNTYVLNRCSCGSDTIFLDSLFIAQWEDEPPDLYHACFFNLTRDMNGTIVHFL